VIERYNESLALAVIRRAAVDHFIGLEGRTPAGHKYPGLWLNRAGPSRAKARQVRADADWFLFSTDPDAVWLRDFWFRAAGWHSLPTPAEVNLVLERTIRNRHPREPFCL
jgi:hypothetical protein